MFRPMLAPNEDPMKNPRFFEELKFPLLCSPKLDGIRCIIRNGRCKSRSFKDIPNLMIQELFGGCNELDGELISGNPSDYDVYNRTQSIVMSRDKVADSIKLYVFDTTDESFAKQKFSYRLIKAYDRVVDYNDEFNFDNLVFLHHKQVNSIDELLEYEAIELAKGYEGIMMRAIDGIYKHGRGTFKEGLIYKLKRFSDDEAVILDFIEQMNNENEQKYDAFGLSERSTNKEGLVRANTLGKFIVQYGGNELEIAPGVLKHVERKFIWDNREQFRGAILKFRHFAHGVKDKPRFPRFVGFRNEMDLG